VESSMACIGETGQEKSVTRRAMLAACRFLRKGQLRPVMSAGERLLPVDLQGQASRRRGRHIAMVFHDARVHA